MTLAEHPLLLEARRLLEATPTIGNIDVADEGIRWIAAQQAVRRCIEEAAERLITLLDEYDGDPDCELDIFGHEDSDTDSNLAGCVGAIEAST